MTEHFTRNVRFWVHHGDSLVKLTLRPEQTIGFECGGSTEEGFHVTYESFYYDADRGGIEHDSDSRGRDCDGAYSTSWGGWCAVGDEQRVELTHDGSDRCWGPRWKQETQSQRDMTAEAMGY
mgnify:FL=1|jgi:hypothetical protein